MRRLRRLVRLPAAERGLLVKAAILLWAIRLGLWLLPFQTLRALLVRVARPPAGSPPRDPSVPDRIAWGVAVASRYLPRATCLTQALAAQALLARNGHPACVRIGVATTGARQFHAHAWVESQGRVVFGGSEVQRYAQLATFRHPAP